MSAADAVSDRVYRSLKPRSMSAADAVSDRVYRSLKPRSMSAADAIDDRVYRSTATVYESGERGAKDAVRQRAMEARQARHSEAIGFIPTANRRQLAT